DGGVVDDGAVDVDVMHDRGVYVDHGGVVTEVAAFPAAADEADAAVAIAVVNATVETDMGTPVAAVPSVDAAALTPVTRRPKETRSGGCDPNAGHPVVAQIPIGPITGRPEIAVDGAWGLNVYGQGGRRHTDGNAHRHAELRIGRGKAQ